MAPSVRPSALAAVALLLRVLPSSAWGTFGHRGWPHAGVRDPYGMSQRRPPDLRDPWGGELLRERTCPPYLAPQISTWRHTKDGGLSVQARLPDAGATRARLGRDGRSVVLSALRPLAAERCLPRGARRAPDGRHELLEVSAPLPPGWTSSGASLRRLSDGVVELLLPPQRPSSAGGPGGQDAAVVAAEQANVTKDEERRGAEEVAEDAAKLLAEFARREERLARLLGEPSSPDPDASVSEEQGQPSEPEVLGGQATLEEEKEEKDEESPCLRLLSEGLLVVDEDYPEAPKLPGAAEGWLDKGGAFHHY